MSARDDSADDLLPPELRDCPAARRLLDAIVGALLRRALQIVVDDLVRNPTVPTSALRPFWTVTDGRRVQ